MRRASCVMTLSTGTRLGPYEVLGSLGAGGMGEVYRARDTRLQRDVAIKVLPEYFAADPERLARFEREAQLLAALNHSNIAAIYGVEDSGAARALVLELVEGPTLADRIAQGPIPIDEALPIARQIAEALEAAHEQGIIHRDLKPANIKVRPDGTVKVLDFGLAKAFGPAEDRAGTGAGPYGLSQSPTITSPAVMGTAVGVILGTAAYMAPEQAKGGQADKRSDIWAFGAVLFEMLTGTRAFEGDDVSDTLATILKGEPNWNALPPSIPPAIHSLIARCLVKDRRQRIGAVSTALYVLRDPASVVAPASTLAPAVASTRPMWRRAAPVAVAFAVGAAFALAWALSVPRSPAPAVSRFPIVLGADESFTNTGRQVVAISPDGRRIVNGLASGPAGS